jgi:hypothetical protein
MTREREDELRDELRALRIETNKMIQRIVDARIAGLRDDEAITAMRALSHRRVELTRPNFELAA